MIITERDRFKPIVYGRINGTLYRINTETGDIKVYTPHRLATSGWVWRGVRSEKEASKVFLAYMKANREERGNGGR